jgi:hypothetical protein
VTRTSSRISRGTTAEEGDFMAQHSPRHLHSMQAPQSGLHRQQQESGLLQPLVMQFSVMLQVCKCMLLSPNFNIFIATVVSAVVVSYAQFFWQCLQSKLFLEELSSLALYT